ncbi:RNA methyltransferase [Flavobacterium sp. NKUCC04_CG]|uniref:TrmH family RNA methyltransferase n=1 Tax=Flavobacterium sp. NKUCC04_CG TaxID=2842121 RepID=UPI001C5B87E3|nr:RNA methyltransferase [Flavobacterium sp. NKUCC04_CG]MBW3518154.1 RNA methyltransferase [Flavobacterium sp. NKUCC04_CG]
MVTKNQIKLIKSLQQKKYRKQHQLFLAEGVKVIQELVNSNLKLQQLFCTEVIDVNVDQSKVVFISNSELSKITALNTANNCLAIFEIPEVVNTEDEGLIVVLDDVRDPGNMGTIIRLCDWFGIKSLVCSPQTVDVYNPKVIQATMGSVTRVAVVYKDLVPFLEEKASWPIFGTFMDGVSIYREELPANGIIVMGNEANGISEDIAALVNSRIAIPRFGDLQQTESLNVAMATAIVLSEFSRHK